MGEDAQRLSDATDEEVVNYARERIEELNLALEALGLRELFWTMNRDGVLLGIGGGRHKQEFVRVTLQVTRSVEL